MKPIIGTRPLTLSGDEKIIDPKSLEDKVHELKCIEPYFTQIKTGFKNFEVRKDDRGYQAGEYLKLMKYDPQSETYANEHPIWGRIKYKLEGGQFGIEKGYCVLGMDFDSVLSSPIQYSTKY